jgi:hypothetical protein
MNRIIDFALAASTVSMIAYAGAVGPLRTATTILNFAQVGHPALGVAARPPGGEAKRTGPIDDAMARNCLIAGSSAAAFNLCPAGRTTLHISRSPVRERTTYPVIKTLSILPDQ